MESPQYLNRYESAPQGDTMLQCNIGANQVQMLAVHRQAILEPSRQHHGVALLELRVEA